MSEPENFLSRWSRLKREAALEVGERTLPVEDASPGAGPITPTAVDRSSLPTIESIGPGSDISAFLQAGVPAELTRAALRSAWVADPAIRGFIEIADNQWDFNEHGAIPGFGALGAADHAREWVTRAIGRSLNNVMTVTSEVSQDSHGGGTPDSPPATPVSVAGPRVIDEVWQVGATTARAQPGAQPTVIELDASPEVTRCHGTALPK
jgi:Protein of unknown function (DUF3306)